MLDYFKPSCDFFLNMESFFIDRLGDDCDDEDIKTGINESGGENFPLNISKIDLFDELPDNLKFDKTKSKSKNIYSTDDTYLITNYKNVRKEEKSLSSAGKILEKSVIQSGLETRHSVPLEKSKKALKLNRKKLAEKTKGKKWFDMKATELTEEIKTDFELLKMRSVLDKKHVYKKNDITNVPKYFHVGKIIETPADFYSGRIPKSQRKKTMVEELLADAEFKKYQKKKFKEIMDENRWKKKSKTKKTAGNKLQKKRIHDVFSDLK